MKIFKAEENSAKFGVPLPSGPSERRLLARCFDMRPSAPKPAAFMGPGGRSDLDARAMTPGPDAIACPLEPRLAGG